MRETDSRLMRPRKDHSLKHFQHWRTNGHQEADNVRHRYYATGNTDQHLCRPTGAVVHQPLERSLAGFSDKCCRESFSGVTRGDYTQPW